MAKDPVQELDEQFKSAVDNYGAQIKTLKSHVEAVRQNVGMWLSGIGDRAFLSMQREVFQNSVDQILLDESPANFVYFYYNENTLETIVEDNGLGFPFEDIERIITVPNTSKNYEKTKGIFQTGLHGAGLKASNAVTLDLVAESYKYDGTAVRFTTHQGYPVHKKNKPNPEPIPNKQKKQGSKIWFTPDQSVLGELNLSWKDIYELIKNIIIRTPIGTVCRFEAVDKNGVTHKEDIVNKDGIVTNLIEMSSKPICKPIEIFNNDGWMRLNAVFVFDGGDNPTGLVRVTSYCNMCPTIAGTHTDGTIDGICKWFTKYMNDIFLTNNKTKVKVTAADIKSNVVISIAADMVEPVFIGQAKEQLANKEMAPFCRDSVINCLNDWSKANPNELLKICKYLKEVAEMRAKNDKVKENIVNKFQSNAITGYPAKFSRPIKQKEEFIIVEGDEASSLNAFRKPSGYIYNVC